MSSYRYLLTVAILQSLVLLALISQPLNQVHGAGVSVPCNSCLVNQLGTQPTCKGVNLTDTTQQSTPGYKTCICDASFDFGWTNTCANTCQPSELTSFQSDFATIIKTFNFTCIKPTPSPTPTPSPSPSPAAAMMGPTGMTTTALIMAAGWTMVATIAMVLVTL
ncbi:hypothetical protein BG004_003032 [Podila humilis]|nr:hypothetical protein BG004_003032 [Podila humilis]